jgi:hypothetical protein
MDMAQTVSPMESVVMRIDLLPWEFDLSDVVEEDLSVAQLPVTETDHEERSKLQNIKGTIVQSVV